MMEGSMAARVEDEASSSSWMLMAAVMKMLQEALKEIEKQTKEEGSLQAGEALKEIEKQTKEEGSLQAGEALKEIEKQMKEEGSLQAGEEVEVSLQAEEEVEAAEEKDSSSPKSETSLSLELPKLFDESGSSEQMPHKLIKGKESIEMEENYSHPSSWVVDMEKILNSHTNRRMEQAQWTRPSIYQVPEWLNSMTKREAYQPQVVSLGPFHHGERHPMEEHKRRLMLHMVKRSGKPLAQYFDAIKEVAKELQDAYHGLDEINWCSENADRFVTVMVTDGAFLLEMMSVVGGKILADDYAPNDPIFSVHSILSLWARIQSDMILVENQVPLLALSTLEAVRRGISPSNADIDKLVNNFLCLTMWNGQPTEENIDTLGLHLLDKFHKCFCGVSQNEDHQGSDQSESLMLSAVELREAGVQFKKSNNLCAKDIDFNNGVLSMPLVEIDDASERMFLNLMAFERLHCRAGKDATAYMIFMDHIIDSERDVALLRSKGILKNFLSSDKAAAQLFNSLGKGATLDPNSKICHVQWKVAMHCKKPGPKLQASFKHTYMRNPWVFISGVAAFILLALTILQTIYTVMPYYTKN